MKRNLNQTGQGAADSGFGAERNVGAMTTAATHGNHANLVGSSVLC